MCTIKIRDSREDITTQLFNINKSYKHHNTSQGPRGLEYKCSIIDEPAETTIPEYRHKLNKFALRRLAQTGIQIERGAGLLPGILLTTHGRRQRAARSSRPLQCSRGRRRRWRLAPGLQHLVATIRYRKGKRGRKATVSTHPKYSQARSYTTYVCIGIKWNKGIICGLNCRMPE